MTGHDPDIEGTAHQLQVSHQDVSEMEQRMLGEFSLDAAFGENDDVTLLETIPDERMNQEELLGSYQQERELKLQIKKALEGLNEKERFIIANRVTSDDPQTLQDIAEHFQISRERIRQIEERALQKLKQILTPQLAISN